MPSAGATRATTRPGRVRGLLAALALLLLGVGIPLALLAIGSTTYLAELAHPDRWRALLLGPDDGTLFLGVLAAIAWLGWATFAVAVVVEVPAQLRGVSAVRVRGLGVQQSLAGGLVAAALTVVLLPGTANAAQRPADARSAGVRAPVAVALHPVSATDHLIAPATDSRPPAKAHGNVHTVRRGDTLWDIAETYLHDGPQWRLIADLNYGRRQADGGSLDRSHVLHPGWRLELPAQVLGDTRAIPGDERKVQAGRTHVVTPGETLSAIAQDELGSADRWPEIVDASASVVEPGGERLTDPARIYPGWKLRIPGLVTRATEQAPPPSRAERTRTADDRRARAGQLDPGWEGRPGASEQSGHASVPAHRPVDPGASKPRDDELDDLVDVRTIGGVGGLLAGSLLLLLAARRAQQQRRRRPGQRIPMPPRSVLATEARLRAVAEPAGVRHIDRALRALAAEYRGLGRPLPELRSARLTRTHLELYITAPTQLPHPWAATSDPTVWALSHEELTAQPESDTRAPYPSLVSIGHDLEGGHVLLDLEQAGALSVEGPRADALPILAAIAVELATSPWADDLLVTLVGCLPELPGTVTTGRLRHVGRLDQLVTELEGRAVDVERVLSDAEVPDLPTARGAGVADDAWPPEIVLLAGDVAAPMRDRLERVLFRVPRVGIAAVTAGTNLGEWSLRVDGDASSARLEPLGLTLRPQRLSGSEYKDVLEILRTSDADAVAGPSWAASLPSLEQTLADLPTPSPGEMASTEGDEVASPGNDREDEEPVDSGEVPSGQVSSGQEPSDQEPSGQVSSDQVSSDQVSSDQVSSDQVSSDQVPFTASPPGEAPFPQPPRIDTPPARAPYVRLFGSVEVVGAAGPQPVAIKDGRAVANHVVRATALVAYLACHPRGATVEQIGEALSPVRRLAPSTLWSLASRTRKWLGSDADGLPYFPRTSDAGMTRLHPAVRTDWADWQQMVGADVTATSVSRLIDALALVRGRPFEGASDRHFAWAEPLRQEMIASVVDVAHEVVRRALLVPDPASARRALGVGRRVDPTNELLWRDALRLEYVAGSHESRRRLIEQVYALADDLETDLEPETERLIAEIEGASLQRAGVR